MLFAYDSYTKFTVVLVYTQKAIWYKKIKNVRADEYKFSRDVSFDLATIDFDVENPKANGWTKKYPTQEDHMVLETIESMIDLEEDHASIIYANGQLIPSKINSYFYIIPPLKELKNLTCYVSEIDCTVPRKDGTFDLPRDQPDSQYYIVDFFQLGSDDGYYTLENIYTDLAEYRVDKSNRFKLPDISTAVDIISKHSNLGTVVLTYESSETPRKGANLCFTNYFAKLSLDSKLAES
ncbi:hypothetical protein DLEV_087 [Diachasmimorpha longicaudata entomopoxvirus]|uniref:Uncharacterized protein n=1 Tax=Diachasmimorpha longicaudata entomopoxvirus TaxID=109981 RepID=A0A7R5WRZ6_9POXV|nr:hypothetical protein QKK69_gp087 [Diachasmimorpha longicaudata entomopoxvirus]AKS26378.1 hypothetical protein DLEV_087 [Diachasmimorpha longicaudata entomopoxvirus]